MSAIGTKAFYGCTGLQKISVYSHTEYTYIRRDIFEGCYNISEMKVNEDYERPDVQDRKKILLVLPGIKNAIIEEGVTEVKDIF